MAQFGIFPYINVINRKYNEHAMLGITDSEAVDCRQIDFSDNGFINSMIN
jgi:hypothetical protein